MPRTVNYNGTVHTFPDDATDAEIADALGSESQQPTPTEKKTSLTEKAANALPTVGGMVGSLVGGIPGAGIGGAAGQGYGTLIRKAREIPGAVADVARNVVSQPGATMQGFLQGAKQGAVDSGIAGATQAALDAGGRVIGAGFKAGAPRLMQSMLKPSKAIRDSFPTVAQDAVDAGISIGRRGQEKVGRLISASSQRVHDVLAAAQGAGAAPVQMADVITELNPVAQKIAQEPISAAKLGQLNEIGAQALKENPLPIPLTQAQTMKQAAQRVARDGYKRVAAGADINAVGPDANMAIARGLRKEIEKRAPSVGPLNEQTQKLIGVDDALENALGRIANNQPVGMNDALSVILGAGGYGVAGPPGIGAGLLMKALTTPATASRIAIGMDRLAPLASHAPNAIRAALLARLAGQ